MKCVYLQSCLLLAVFAANGFVATADRPAKEYILNLDLPEEQRWNQILDDHKGFVVELINVLGKIVPKEVIPLVTKLASGLNKYLPEKYAREITGIANHLNLTVGDVLLPNIIYDASAFCTSIISTDSRGQIWHSRNLDYRFTETLKNLTIVYHAQRNGKYSVTCELRPPKWSDYRVGIQTLFTASTFVGYIGTVTGQKPKVFTITSDTRDKGAAWMNMVMALFDRKAKLVSFLERDTLEVADSFAEAVQMLSESDTIAPVYFIVGGVNPNEGAVITKSRLGSRDVWFLDSSKGRWYLVETNYDHWLSPPTSDDRRDPAIKMMNATGQVGINKASLFKIMSTPPVLNAKTTYTVIMSAAQPEVYQTTVRTGKHN